MTSAPINPAQVQEQVNPHRPRKAPPPPRYTPNIVPLIDVLFMLLLFFLLSTRFRQTEVDIPATLPGGGKPAAGPIGKTELKIILVGDGEDNLTSVEYQCGSMTRCIKLDDLRKQLKTRQEQLGAESPVTIIPDPRVRWEYVVQAYNEAVRAKFKTISFMEQQ